RLPGAVPARRHAEAAARRAGRDVRVAGRARAVPALAQGGRHRAQPDRGQPRDPRRPVVEPGRGGPGHRPGVPDRPATERPGAQVRLRRHAGGADRRDDRGKEGPGRAGRGYRRGLAHRAVRRRPARRADPVPGRGERMSEFRGRWEEWPPAKPIRVEGGIKARSKRGAIGEQWWSRRFIGVLEAAGLSGRLARGRSYARAGQVLDFRLSQGKVTAQVQGSRVRPYDVRLGVLPLTKPQWRRVTERLASQALFRAKLLAGEMPHEIEDVFAECGTPLFPRSATDLDMHCSCPDWGVPCKHLAAVCYVLAEEFDRDPFAMLAWRGKLRDALLAALRTFRSAPREPAPSGPGAPGQTGAPAA